MATVRLTNHDDIKADLRIAEKDILLFHCKKANGFLHSFYTMDSSNEVVQVDIFPVDINSPDSTYPNIDFVSFQVIPHVPEEAFNTHIVRKQALVYGRKIKLLHVASNKYLSLSSRNKESNCASLVDPDSCDENCIFKLLPARVGRKQIGDEVTEKDAVKIASAAEIGQHFLITHNPQHAKSFHLISAVGHSIFTIYRRTFQADTIQGGSVVMIYNEKREAHLYGANLHDTGTRQVGARKSEKFDGVQAPPSMSGDLFWQLEKADSPINGDSFEFGDKFRIKHVPTLRYLTVNEDNTLVLQKDTRQDPTVFIFAPVNNKKKEGQITSTSSVRLIHEKEAERQCLCVPSSYITYSTTGHSQTQRLFQLQLESWSSIKKKDSEKYNFILIVVTSEWLRDFYRVYGVSVILQNYSMTELPTEQANKESAGQKKPTYSIAISTGELNNILADVAQWIKSSPENCTNRADMLRSTKVVNILVVDIFSKYLENIEDQKKALCHTAGKLLALYVKEGNRISKAYITRSDFLLIFSHMIGKGIGAEDILSALAKYDSLFINMLIGKVTSTEGTALEESHVDTSPRSIFDDLPEKLNVSTLNFLSSLCFMEGPPIVDFQNIIREKVMSRHENEFFKIEITDDKVYFIYPPDIGPIENLASQPESLEFYVAQLNLFSSICKGVNVNSINWTKKFIGMVQFEKFLTMIFNNNIPPSLKAAFLKYVLASVIDKAVGESGVNFDGIWHCYCWDNLDDAPIDNFPHTVSGITQFMNGIEYQLEQRTDLYSIVNILELQLLLCLLDALHNLVAHGFYFHKTINEDDKEVTTCTDGCKIVRILVQMLKSGLNHNSTPSTDDHYAMIVQIKIRAIKVLHLFFKFNCYTINKKFIEDFQLLRDSSFSKSSNNPPPERLKLLLNAPGNTWDRNDKELKKATRSRLKHFMSDWPSYFQWYSYTQPKSQFYHYTGQTDEHQDQDLLQILLENISLYQNDSLFLLISSELLFDMYHTADLLFHEVSRSYIVNTRGSADREATFKYLLLLGSQTDKEQILLQLIQGLTHSSDDSDAAIIEALEKVSAMCFLAQDKSVPNICNQNLALTSGVFYGLVTYVLQFQYANSLKKSNEKMFRKVCYTLQYIAAENPIAQKAMFLYFTDFLKIKFAASSMAMLLTEIVTNNVLICHKMEDSVSTFFSELNYTQDEEFLEYFYMFIAIIKVNKESPLFLKENQIQLSSCLTEYKHDYYFFNKDREEKMATVLNILKEERYTFKVKQLLGSVDMLAACCGGVRGEIEVIGQRAFNINQLMSIIIDEAIPLERKKPFVCLLNETYFDTETSSVDSIQFIIKKNKFWAHVKWCNQLLNQAQHKLQELDQLQVKLAIRLLTKKFQSINAWMESTQDTLGSCTVSLNKSTPVPLNALLLYVIDGLHPLLASLNNQLTEYSSFKFPQIPADDIESIEHIVADIVTYTSPSQSIDLQEELHLNKAFQQFILNYAVVHGGLLGSTYSIDDSGLPLLERIGTMIYNEGNNQLIFEKLLRVLRTTLYQDLSSEHRNVLNSLLLKLLQVCSDYINSGYGIAIQADQLKPVVDEMRLHLFYSSDGVAYQILSFYCALLKHSKNKRALKSTQNAIASLDSSSSYILFLKLGKLLAPLESLLSLSSSEQLQHRFAIRPPSVSSQHSLSGYEMTTFTSTVEVASSEGETGLAYQIVLQLIEDITENEAKADIALEMVSLLCDKQNCALQNAFSRHKFQNVKQIVQLMQTLANYIQSMQLTATLQENYIKIVKKVVQALIELCAGNIRNQGAAVKGQIIDSINVILQQSHLTPSPSYFELQLKCIELLQILLEPTDMTKSEELAQVIVRELDIDTLVRTLQSVKDNASSFEHEISLFRGYNVFKTVNEYFSETDESEYFKGRDVHKHLQEWGHSVEIKYKKTLTRVHFPVDPKNKLNWGEKQQLQYSITNSLDDITAKPTGRVEFLLDVRDSIEYEKKIRSIKLFEILLSMSISRFFFLCFLTIVLNLMALFFLVAPDRSDSANGSTSNNIVAVRPRESYQLILLYVLGALHLLLSLLMVFEYFLTNWHHILFKLPISSQMLWNLQVLFHKQKAAVESLKQPTPFQIYFFSFNPLYRIAFLIGSILGLATSGYFYSICLFYLLVGFSVFDIVTTAIKRTVLSMMIVFFMGFFILNIFAVFSFTFLNPFFNPEEDTYCDSLLQCFFTVVREGLIDTLGAGLPLNFRGEESSSFGLYWPRAIFDVLFFISITTVGLNIIIAIIVDQFSALRENREKNEALESQQCIICLIESGEFDRKGEGFIPHITRDHNKWNYLYFFQYLQRLPEGEYNALEQYVSKCISDRNNINDNFMPHDEALVFGPKKQIM